MSNFFSRLSYSFGNEDWETEHRALSIQPGDRVLCITASGDRPLHVLLDRCQEVVTVDSNGIQNDLLELKCLALRELDYDHYLRFLGAEHETSHYRKETLKKLLPHMNSHAAHYWSTHQKMVGKGVLYQGLIEKWTTIISSVFGITRGAKVNQLFSYNNIIDQRKFVKSKEWDSPMMRKAFHYILNPRFIRHFLKDPGLYNHLPDSIGVGMYLYNRINHCLSHCLAKESPLISLILKGKVYPEGYPPYLTEKGFHIIKKRLNNLIPKTSDVIDYLELQPENSFDCFSLSDVASYMNEASFRRLLKAVLRTAKPGARFSLREFLSHHHFPKELESNFLRNPSLEKKLEKEDRCFVYRFIVGKIAK